MFLVRYWTLGHIPAHCYWGERWLPIVGAAWVRVAIPARFLRQPPEQRYFHFFCWDYGVLQESVRLTPQIFRPTQWFIIYTCLWCVKNSNKTSECSSHVGCLRWCFCIQSLFDRRVWNSCIHNFCVCSVPCLRMQQWTLLIHDVYSLLGVKEHFKYLYAFFVIIFITKWEENKIIAKD